MVFKFNEPRKVVAGPNGRAV